jgi:glycosyltransferase involved in cell wall biosynthesis
MKINIVMGFFLPVPALAGGATEKIWLRLGELMAAAGHDVTIVSRRWPGLPDRSISGRLTHLRLRGMGHTRSLPANLALDFIWGLRVAAALPPGDIVVCNTVSLPAYLRFVRRSAGLVAVVLGRMPKGQNRAYDNVDLVLATSEAVAAKARSENPRLDSRIRVFPNPVDWPLHAEAGAQKKSGQPLAIGYVGRIHPEKGLEQLLDAAVKLAARTDLPEWRLALIGPVSVAQGGGGEAYRDALIAHYAPLLGDRLTFTPPVFDAPALARLYGELDVFCYPSLAAKGEGLSIAPIEAMAAGAVPVVSRLDCYRDLIKPGENGCQFDHERPDAVTSLAEILAALLADPARRHALAGRAQTTARRHDYAEVAAGLLANLSKLLLSPKRESTLT